MMYWNEWDGGNNHPQIHGNNYTLPWRMSQKQDAKNVFDLVGLNSHSVDPCSLVSMRWCCEWGVQIVPGFLNTTQYLLLRVCLYYCCVFYFHGAWIVSKKLYFIFRSYYVNTQVVREPLIWYLFESDLILRGFVTFSPASTMHICTRFA